MEYTLKKQQGDSLAVPKLVFANLTRADGDTVRVALYLLGGGGAEPAQIAHDLGLKSARQAQAALEWWAGAGLLE
ncbi:DNA replication protein DnaD, partial [Fournierella massiliensis]|nr:DNA replication protein DnaD [Fournierella massiliensis]